MASSKKTPVSLGKWIDDINDGVGKYVKMETRDGVVREGRLSGLRTRQIVFNGKIQEIVTELELNGDPTDTVDFGVLESVSIN